MTDSKFCRALFIFFLALTLSACSRVFEHEADVQARKALQDLMTIQEKYHQKHNRYARNLLQIKDYNLKYHTGVVYLQIEYADQNGYRAIALPAESTTARVFAYDTKKGGYYEMEEEEVAQYVLGALNFIRKEQAKKQVNDGFSLLFLGILLALGVRFVLRHREKENRPLSTAYFLGLGALAWALAVLNHMGPDIVFSGRLIGLTGAALLLAVLSLGLNLRWLAARSIPFVSPTLLTWVGCTSLLSLFSGGVMIHTLIQYL